MADPLDYRPPHADPAAPVNRVAVVGRVALWLGTAAASLVVLGITVQVNKQADKGTHLYGVAAAAAGLGLLAAAFALRSWQGRLGLGLSLLSLLWLGVINWC